MMMLSYIDRFMPAVYFSSVVAAGYVYSEIKHLVSLLNKLLGSDMAEHCCNQFLNYVVKKVRWIFHCSPVPSQFVGLVAILYKSNTCQFHGQDCYLFSLGWLRAAFVDPAGSKMNTAKGRTLLLSEVTPLYKSPAVSLLPPLPGMAGIVW